MKKIRTIKMRIYFVVAMLIVTLGSSSLMAQVTNDSTTWEGSYEADAKLVASGWTEVYGFEAISSIVADSNDVSNNWLHALTIQSEPQSQGAYRYDIPFIDASTNGGVSVEFRLKVTSGQFLLHFYTTGLNYRWLTTYVSDTSFSIKDSDTNPGVTQGNDSDWHVYRITCDDVTWKLYRDTFSEPVLTLPVVMGYGEWWTDGFALYGVTTGTDFDLDYLRWTDEGALYTLPVCGDLGTEYKSSDFNKDCYVNLEDLIYIVDEWLECTDPEVADCDQYWK